MESVIDIDDDDKYDELQEVENFMNQSSDEGYDELFEVENFMKNQVKPSIKPNISHQVKSQKVPPTSKPKVTPQSSKNEIPKSYQRTNIGMIKKPSSANKISKVAVEKYVKATNPPKSIPKKYEECPNCDLKFTVLKDLEEHFNSVHDSEEDDEIKDHSKRIQQSPIKSLNFQKKTPKSSILNKSLPLDNISTSSRIQATTKEKLTQQHRGEIQSSISNLSSAKKTPTSLNKSLPVDNSSASKSQVKQTSSKELLAEQYRREIQRKIELNNSKKQKVPLVKPTSTTIQRPKPSVNSSLILENVNSKNIIPPPVSTPFKPIAKEVKKPVLVKFVPDLSRLRIKDVGTAVLPASSSDPFLNSFFAFFHEKPPAPQNDSTEEVSTITYEKADPDHVNEEEVEEIDLDTEPDPLMEHIKESGLSLKMRPPTLSDGNCWYDAVADQIRLMEIPDKPTDHADVRDEVTKSLLNLPQTPFWIQNFFNNSNKNFRKFIARHRRLGTWTDNLGILCQATAFYLGRNIHIVGTANVGQKQSFTKLEAGPEADKFPPLFIGYYQDKHYQSLEFVPTQDEDPEDVHEEVTMDDVIEDVLDKVLLEIHQRAMRPKKRCKVMPIKPFKGFAKTPEEIERERVLNVKIDLMLGVLNRRIVSKPNDQRLEIFQNLQKIDTIMDFYQISHGGVQKSVSEHLLKEENVEDDDEEEEVEEEIPKEVPKAEVKDVKKDEDKSEPVTHILDVFKCNKCNHAFEKINLFVKHFIKVHKDVIDANKNSSSFSFSNYWTKMKVRASVKKKNEEQEANDKQEVEEKETKKEEIKPKKIKKPKVSLMDELTALKLIEVKKPKSSVKSESDKDLILECESKPFIIGRKVHLEEDDDSSGSSRSLSVDQFCYQSLPANSFDTNVFIVDDHGIGQDKEVLNPELTDKYQMIPLSEIKIENPFEDLPFNWKYDDYMPETSPSGLSEVLDLHADDLALGLVKDSELAALDVLAAVMENVENVLDQIYKEDEVEELFNEHFHDATKSQISHQVYIKDFTWIPLEDQFLDCPDFEQEDIKKMFDIKKLRSDEDKKTAVKSLLLITSNNHDIMKNYITKIVGDKYLPEEADHGKRVPAKAKYIKFDHNYLQSTKARKLGSAKPPGNVVETLKRMQSKVEIFPSNSLDLERKPSFVGVRPKRKIMNQDLFIYANKKPNKEVKPTLRPSVGRGRIQIFSKGKENEFPKQFLDIYLEKQNKKNSANKDVLPVPATNGLSESVPDTAPSKDTENSSSNLISASFANDDRKTKLQVLKDQKSGLVITPKLKSQKEGIKSGSSSVIVKTSKQNPMEIGKENVTVGPEITIKKDILEFKDIEQDIPKISKVTTSIGKPPQDETKVTPEPQESIEDAWKSIDEFLDTDNPTVDKVVENVPTSNVTDTEEESINYESQLNNHLDSLREPVEIVNKKQVPKPPGPPTSPDSEPITSASSPLSSSSLSLDILSSSTTTTSSFVSLSSSTITTSSLPLAISSSYSIKQEPVEMPPSLENNSQEVDPEPAAEPSYNIKLEPVTPSTEMDVQEVRNTAPLPFHPSINIKQEMDVYGFLGIQNSGPLKAEMVKQEPVEHFSSNEDVEDDDDIEILSTSNPNLSQEVCDVVTNVLRCQLCFKSFFSQEDLNLHSESHSMPMETDQETSFNEHQWLTPERETKICEAAFPKIRLKPVSLEGHDYIFGKMDEGVVDAKSKDDQEKVVKEKEGKKVKNMTVLQALDSLLQPAPKKVENKVVPEAMKPTSKVTNQAKKSSKFVEMGKKGTAKTVLEKKESSSTSSVLTCQVCLRVNTTNMESMRKHLTYHPHAQCLGKVKICNICDEKFDPRDLKFDNHVEKHLAEMMMSPKNQCQGCKATFRDSESLLNHLKDVHEKKKIFPCSICNESFERRKKLILHLDTIHGSTN